MFYVHRIINMNEDGNQKQPRRRSVVAPQKLHEDNSAHPDKGHLGTLQEVTYPPRFCLRRTFRMNLKVPSRFRSMG